MDFDIEDMYFRLESYWTIGLSRTRQQLISVRDILFAQPKVNTSWLQQGHIL